MKRPTTFCVVHDREWTGEPADPCPWCEIERLRVELDALHGGDYIVLPMLTDDEIVVLEAEEAGEERHENGADKS